MKWIVRPRGSGKTEEAIEWLRADKEQWGSLDSPGRILLVHSESEKLRLMKTYKLKYQQVETYETAMRGYYVSASQNVTLWVDNVDMLLSYLFRNFKAVAGGSATDE